MAFRFRLDTVLRHRRRIVEERSRELATAEGTLQDRRDGFEELENRFRRAVDERESDVGTLLHLGDLMTKRIWLEHLGNRRDLARHGLKEAMAARDDSRKRLEEAWRQQEVLDRLRARKESAHRARADRFDTQIMDEIATVRHPTGRPAKTTGYPAGYSSVSRGSASGKG